MFGDALLRLPFKAPWRSASSVNRKSRCVCDVWQLSRHLAHRGRVEAGSGLRVSEVLALRWEHIDFEAGAMLVQQGVVNGRIGKVKTEASHDDVPIDPAFAEILLRW